MRLQPHFVLKNGVGKRPSLFRIRLKPDAQRITQRPSKVQIHYRYNLNTVPKELEKFNIIKQNGFCPDDKPIYGTIYIIPHVIIPKGDSIKRILDPRHPH